MEPFEITMRRGGSAALEEAEKFFMREDRVHRTLRRLAQRLEQLKIPYAVADGMALVAHGYERTTVDVDLLVDARGLEAIHEHFDGLGYVPPFSGSKNLRDADTGVRIEFIITGQYPGDGKPKPVSFPDPSSSSVSIDGIRYLSLETLVELKLASGMTNPGRLRDLADVQELIRVLGLDDRFAERLNPFVRDKFGELRRGLADDPSPFES